MQITKISAFQVYDSRGNPTVEAAVTLANGIQGTAIVPSGASTGSRESLELRDGDPARFLGRAVFRAVENINGEINQLLQGQNVTAQSELDERLIELDGTENKRRLGANAILAVSMASARAAARALDLPLYAYLGGGGGTLLPLPEIQIIGGGAHTLGRIDVQDFMIICPEAQSFGQCLEITFNVYHRAAAILKERGKLAGLADEGGFWPLFETNEEVFELLLEAISRAGYAAGREVALSLDLAATGFFREGSYQFRLENRSFSPKQFSRLLTGWCEKYPIISLEDPFAEDDRDSWAQFTEAMGQKIQIVGDDLFTTNLKFLQDGIEHRLANSVLIKPNQIGTVTETMACIKAAQQAGWLPIVSARSGETEDPFIAHLAVATNAGQLKVGSFARSERMVKWNELIRIERELGSKSRFLGGAVFQQILKRSPTHNRAGETAI